MTKPRVKTKNLPVRRPGDYPCKKCGGFGHYAKACHKQKKPLPEVRAPESSGDPRPVRVAQAPVSNHAGELAKGPLPEAPKGASPRRSGSVTRARFEEAVEVITEPERRGEGWRHGWLGNTGKGKTTAIKRLLEHKTGDTLTLIHDDTKAVAQYEGQVVELLEQAKDEATELVFRGDPFRGTFVEPDAVAELALKFARAKIPTRFVIDELDRACSQSGRELNSQNVRMCFTLGRAMRLSVLWTTQAPQRAPREVMDQSTTIALCSLGPRALNYLDERLLFDPALLAVVPTLNVGEFVLYQSGREWDRKIYY